MAISPSSPACAVRVEEVDAVARHRLAHAAHLHRLPGRVADLARRLRLAVAVAHRKAPGLAHPLDHLGVERLARAHQLAQLHGVGLQILQDQHPPHRGRRAQGRHPVTRHGRQRLLPVEARELVDEDRGARVPRREKAAPRVLGPAGRADVEVHVPLAQSDPVQGREMPHRIALMGVKHHLGLGRGPRREIEEEGIVRARGTVRLEVRRRRVGLGEGSPAGDLLPHHQAGVVPRHRGQLLRRGRVGDDVPHLATQDPIL